MINKLPIWRYPDTSPSFYETESVTVIEGTAKLHSKMNELIEEYNDFAETYNKKLDDFTATTNEDLEIFETAMRQEFQDFIDVMTLKYNTLETSIEETIGATVDEWLTAHPEATTTVQDKSLTVEKLTDDLKLKTVKDYVTPQMFGAFGDGESDDSDKLQAMLDTGKRVFIPEGRYMVTKQLNATNSIQFDKNAVIEFYPPSDQSCCIKLKGSKTAIVDNVECTIEERKITISGGFTNLSVGDYVLLSNSELVSSQARSYDTKRDILQIESITDNTITFTSAPEWNYSTVSISKYEFIEDVVLDGINIRCIDKKSYTYGVDLQYCRNATVRNCHITNFDYSQINIIESTLCDVHSNCCEVDYSESLQYGIVVTSCQDISIHDNKINSQRTAIDVTRVSNKVTVSNNAVKGNINTHSSINVLIGNNTISDGSILIRGKNVTVDNNNVTNHTSYCLDIEEMGIEGGHIISNNIFNGWFSMKGYQSNIMIINNRINVKKVSSYSNRQSVFRIMTTNPDKKDGFVIRGNWIEYTGSTPPLYCIDTYFGCQTIYNAIVSDNVVINFDTGFDFAQLSGTKGKNLIVKNNIIKCQNVGIQHRLINNTQIVGNTIIGFEKGTNGIWRYDTTANTTGLIVAENYIENFSTGHRVGGTGAIESPVYVNNIFVNCSTESNVTL